MYFLLLEHFTACMGFVLLPTPWKDMCAKVSPCFIRCKVTSLFHGRRAMKLNHPPPENSSMSNPAQNQIIRALGGLLVQCLVHGGRLGTVALPTGVFGCACAPLVTVSECWAYPKPTVRDHSSLQCAKRLEIQKCWKLGYQGAADAAALRRSLAE